MRHALALAEDGLVYAWGENKGRALLGNPRFERELLPQPNQALQGVLVGSIAAAGNRSYALTDTGELWAWGIDSDHWYTPLGHDEVMDCPLPRPMESSRGIKVDAVAAGADHTFALADDGSVHTWGNRRAARSGALGLGVAVRDAAAEGDDVRSPQRIPGLRVACGL
jgi:alpha-tubulin suppressor-like RCC1 family protein